MATQADKNAAARAGELAAIERDRARQAAEAAQRAAQNSRRPQSTGNLGTSTPAQQAPSAAAIIQQAMGGLGGQPQTISMDPVRPQAVQSQSFAPQPVAQGVSVPQVSSAPLVNQGASNPGLQAAVDRQAARTAQQAGKEGAVDPNLQTQIDRLGNSLSQDTTRRQLDQSASGIRDQLVGVQRSMDTSLSKRQGNNPYGRNHNASQLSDAAARAIAKSSAQIQAGEQGRRDALILGGQSIMAAPGQERLVREGRTNELTNTGVSAAMQPAQLGLQQQQLGLEQWRAQDQSARDTARLGIEAQQGAVNSGLAQRRQAFDELGQLLKLSGY